MYDGLRLLRLGLLYVRLRLFREYWLLVAWWWLEVNGLI